MKTQAILMSAAATIALTAGMSIADEVAGNPMEFSTAATGAYDVEVAAGHPILASSTGETEVAAAEADDTEQARSLLRQMAETMAAGNTGAPTYANLRAESRHWL